MEINIANNFYQNNHLIFEGETLAVLDKQKQKISFNYNEFRNTIFYDEKAFVFERENDEYKFNLNFTSKIAFLDLKEYNVIDIKVIESNYVINKDKIIIEYKLESDEENLNKYEITLKGEIL